MFFLINIQHSAKKTSYKQGTCKKNTLQKFERIKSRKAINSLFENGSSFIIQPFKVVWLNNPDKEAFFVQFAVSVPHKLFPRAVDRNLIKRRVKEAYRKNKHIIYNYLNTRGTKCTFMIIYQSKEKLSFQDIESKIIAILKRLKKEHA